MNLTVTSVAATVRLLHSPVDVRTETNGRKRWAIAMKLGGKTYYASGGAQVLSDAAHPVLLPKGASYSWVCREPGECVLIEFDALETGDAVRQFNLSDNLPLRRIYDRIQASLDQKQPGYDLECKALLYEALLMLERSAHREYRKKETQRKLQPALDYMSTRYFDRGITNDSLAALCGISTVYFRKLFESVHGVPPIRYLNHLRVEKAKSMLESDYASIGQIADSVGCGSIYHFSKLFRAYTGRAPSEYAKEVRRGR